MADYYKILGLSKNASPDEIKRAFRELAQRYHPDKAGGNAEKFKEVNEAYQVLSDTEKRKMYDQYGETFEQARAKGGFGGFEGFRDFASYAEAMKNAGQGFDFSARGARSAREARRESAFGGEDFGMGDLGDIFGDLFGFGGQRTPRGGRRRGGRDIEIEIAIDFKEAIFGTEREVNLDKLAGCQKCDGSGVEPGSKTMTCQKCKGSGQVVQNQSTFFGVIRTAVVCPNCGGEGKVAEKKCHQCKGEGRTKKTQRLKIKISDGIDNGGVIRISGQGEAGIKGSRAGDLYVHVRVRPDSHFERRGNDIFSEEFITISQAVLGGEKDIQTIDGEVKLKIPAGTSSGQDFRLSGKGVPFLHEHGRGDQIVKLTIKIPKHLNKKQKELLEELGREEL